MKKRLLLIAVLAAAFGLISAPSAANAATLTVGSSSGCTGTFPTIQSAVTAAHMGDKIKVCPGTYVEQVTVPAGKNNITLYSQTPFAAIIKAPATMVDEKAIIRVNGAQNVSIRSFTITGPGSGGCHSIEYGVLVDGAGSATIRYNYITLIEDTPFSGCQNGVGVLVGGTSPQDKASASILDNFIDQYQKGGIVVLNPGSKAEIEGNDVQGVGPAPQIAQNGIQVSDGADAEVESNDVSDNVYTGTANAVSTGIVLFGNGRVEISNNHVLRNDVNVFLFDSKGARVTSNLLKDATFDGIDMATDTTFGPATTGDNVSSNVVLNNGNYGIWISDNDTRNNTISHNRFRNNALLDARDDSTGNRSCGTANTWTENDCGTDNKGGCLCDQDNHEDGEDAQPSSSQSQRLGQSGNSGTAIGISGGRSGRTPSPVRH